MVSTALLTFANDPSHPRSSPARKLCDLITATEFVLHVIAGGLPIAAEEKMVSCKQSDFVRSAFSGNRNVITDVRSLESGERVIVARTESKEVGAAS